SALVPLAVARQCRAPVSFRYAFSNFFVCCPFPRYQRPLRSVSISECSSRSPVTGQLGNFSGRIFGPPSSAGFPVSPAPLAALSAISSAGVATLKAGVLTRNDRLVHGIICKPQFRAELSLASLLDQKSIALCFFHSLKYSHLPREPR